MERILINKKDLRKKFIIAYIVVGAILALVLIITGIKYIGYSAGRSKACDIIRNQDEYILEEMEISEDDSDAQVASFAYSYLTRDASHLSDTYDNPFRDAEGDSEYVDEYNEASDAEEDARRSLDVDLGDEMEEAGYECSCITEYLEYTSYGDYLAGNYFLDIIKYHILILVILAIGLIIGGLNLFYEIRKKKLQYVIEGEFIIKIDNNVEKERYLIKNIKNIQLTKFDGMKIIGDGFLLKIMFIENRDQIKDILYNIMYPQQQ